jgi:hypothetical protein
MFVIWLQFLLTLIPLLIVSLVSSANGAGPAALKPVQDILKPVAAPLGGIVGTTSIVAVIWGTHLLIGVIFALLTGYFSFSFILGLLGALLLIVLGTLAGYISVAAFFGAPASGAGRGIDWIKRSFGSIESVLGLVGLLLALWMLIEFILNRFGVYI